MNPGRSHGPSPEGKTGTLAWSAAVPILSHPLTLKNTVLQLCCAWGLMTLVIAVTQAFYGGSLSPGQIAAAASLSARFTGIFAALLLAICLGPLSNRYVVHYAMDKTGIVGQFIRVRRRDWAGSPFFARRSFPAPAGYREVRYIRRRIDWERVTRVRVVGKSRTIVLSRGPFALMRLHCPDEESCRKVTDFVNEHRGGKRRSLKG